MPMKLPKIQGMQAELIHLCKSCFFFKLSGVLPEEEAIKQIKKQLKNVHQKGQAVDKIS